RTHLCLAQPVPPPSTRLRALRQNRCRVHPPRHDPHHAEATRCKLLVMNRNFADGLLDRIRVLASLTDVSTLAAPGRDIEAARKTVSGLVKLLHPNPGT